jgi:hypothetical protein
MRSSAGATSKNSITRKDNYMVLDSSSVLPTEPGQESAVPQNAADLLEQAARDAETEQAEHTDDAADQPQYESAEQQPQQPHIDWDSDENPYRARLRGIQGRLQQEIEEKRLAEQRAQQYEYQMLEYATQFMPPHVAQQRKSEYQQQVAMRAQQAQVAMTQQANEAYARELFVRDVSQRFGIPKEQLARFNDPDSMEYYAQSLANERRKQRQAERQITGNDRFEGEAPGRSAPARRPTNGDEAERMFVEQAQRLFARS